MPGPLLAPIAGLIASSGAAGAGAGGAGFLAGLTKIAGPLAGLAGLGSSGGGATKVNVSQSTSLSAVSSPSIGVVVGSGSATPSTSSSLDTRARSEATQSDPFPPGFFSQPALAPTPRALNDISALPFGVAGASGGLFDNPLLLIGIGAAVLIVVLSRKK